MKLSKEKRDRLLLVVVGTLACLAAGYFLLVRSRDDRLASVRQEGERARLKFEEADRFLSASDNLKVTADDFSRRLAEAESAMADGTDPFTWSYRLMDEVRSGHEVDIREITRPSSVLVGVVAGVEYDAVSFVVRGRAYYHEFGKFLADFENRWPYFRVNGLTLSPTKEDGQGPAARRQPGEMLAFELEVVALVKPGS